MKKGFMTVAVMALTWAFAATGFAGATQCPAADAVAKAFVQAFKRDAQVIEVKESLIPGLCEVSMVMNNRKGILYVDPAVKFFVAGQIIDAENGKNLTLEASQELNRFSAEELKQLDALTAFTAGASGKTLYYVTDPQCPYCKKGEENLKKLIGDGKITVKFLLFPLPMHKGADQQCAAIICDNKGLEGLEQGYKSDNQCQDGVKKVQNTLAFLKEKGIAGTPVYIFADGSYHSGLLQEPQLFTRLGIEQKKPAVAETKQPTQPASEQPVKAEQPAAGNAPKGDQPAAKQKQD